MKTPYDWRITILAALIVCFWIFKPPSRRVILRPDVPEEHFDFFQAMEMEQRRVQCEQHCNQWFNAEGGIESITPDGVWICNRRQDGQLVFTAIQTGLLNWPGGYVYIQSGRSMIEFTERTDVSVAGVNIRLGIKGEDGAAIWFGRTVPGPGSNRIESIGIGN